MLWITMNSSDTFNDGRASPSGARPDGPDMLPVKHAPTRLPIWSRATVTPRADNQPPESA